MRPRLLLAATAAGQLNPAYSSGPGCYIRSQFHELQNKKRPEVRFDPGSTASRTHLHRVADGSLEAIRQPQVAKRPEDRQEGGHNAGRGEVGGHWGRGLASDDDGEGEDD